MKQIRCMEDYIVFVEVYYKIYYFVQFICILVVECLYEFIFGYFGKYIVYIWFNYYVYVFLVK